MKKYQKIAYIFLVIFVLSIAFILFKSYANINKNEDEKEKTETEIQRIELSFVNMFNELNNIKFENYRINTSQINKEDLKDKLLHPQEALLPQKVLHLEIREKAKKKMEVAKVQKNQKKIKIMK